MLMYIGVFIIVIGLLFKWFPPRKINSIYGYRTNRSMKNKKTWNYAQLIGANSMMLTGVLLGAIGVIFYFTKINNTVMELIIFLSGFIVMLILDEYKLKKFDK